MLGDSLLMGKDTYSYINIMSRRIENTFCPKMYFPNEKKLPCQALFVL